MTMRARLARAFAAVAVLSMLLAVIAVNGGMFWSMGHGTMDMGHHGSAGSVGGMMGVLLRWSLGAALLAAAAAVLAGEYVSRKIAGPLTDLASGTRQFALRDLRVRLPVPDADQEVADVARAINSMAARLQAEDEARRQMLADVAHELRHPIAVVQGQIELLQDGVRPASPENLAAIQDEVLRLGRMVTDLQDLSLAEAGALHLYRERLTPRALLEPLTANFGPVAEAKGVALAVQAEPDAPPVNADPHRIRQVLVNLVSNALRHTPTGGRVTVTAARRNGDLALTVADTGSGIDPADLPHIFNRFYRADKARSRQSGGTGLGLAICRSLVRLHGGTIIVESGPGEGSLFTVRLPSAE
jgi:two-component system, OmpR family, sensor histidine kinase BaeS